MTIGISLWSHALNLHTDQAWKQSMEHIKIHKSPYGAFIIPSGIRNRLRSRRYQLYMPTHFLL
ncbi:hypothetical protein HanRHA438_Chr03g0109141 [Helianthus annuus]|nr:hypothetical protein HanRHA438_Chr03g0109141 [Helianthus annuus]